MTVTIEIDPNVRTHNNGTFSGFEDADGPVEVGDVVNVVERESGLFGGACVTSVDEERRLIFLSVAWGQLMVNPYRQTMTDWVDDDDLTLADTDRRFEALNPTEVEHGPHSDRHAGP